MDTVIIPVKPLDWVVTKGRFNYGILRVERVTDQCFYSKTDWSSRAIRQSRQSILFAGSEDACTRLHEQLKASAGQFYSEKSEAARRRDARDQQYLDAANTAKASAS